MLGGRRGFFPGVFGKGGARDPEQFERELNQTRQDVLEWLGFDPTGPTGGPPGGTPPAEDQRPSRPDCGPGKKAVWMGPGSGWRCMNDPTDPRSPGFDFGAGPPPDQRGDAPGGPPVNVPDDSVRDPGFSFGDVGGTDTRGQRTDAPGGPASGSVSDVLPPSQTPGQGNRPDIAETGAFFSTAGQRFRLPDRFATSRFKRLAENNILTDEELIRLAAGGNREFATSVLGAAPASALNAFRNREFNQRLAREEGVNIDRLINNITVEAMIDTERIAQDTQQMVDEAVNELERDIRNSLRGRG